MIIKLDNFKIEELKTEYKKSLFCFVDKIFYFCKKEDNFLPNEEDYNDSLFEIPDKYFRIWELEMLLRIVEINAINEEKIEKYMKCFTI